MQLRTNGYGWQKALWKIVSNPAIEVIAAIVVVLIAAWIVVQTDVDQRNSHVPVLTAPR
jgi:ABC-type nickel/cobalt efflux system permease component RcnA